MTYSFEIKNVETNENVIKLKYNDVEEIVLP